MLPPKRIRRPLFEMENFLCSIVGTCLTLKETEKMARRFKYAGDTSPYPLHVWMIEACRKVPEVAKHLQKYLFNKYRLTIKRLDEFEGENLLQVWQEAVGEGRIAGAYFGILTRMDAPAEVISQVFGEVHMMSHLKGAEIRGEMKELGALRLDHRNLQKRLDKLLAQLGKARRDQERLRQGLREKKGEISQLRNKFMQTERHLLRSLTDGAGLERLRAENLELRRQLAAEREQREKIELSLLKEGAQELPKTAPRPKEAGMAAWPPDSRLADCPLDQGGECPLLSNKFILFVGGLDRLEPHYRSLVEADFAGRFMRHDGDCRNGQARLIHMVNRAEAVICPLNCVSHRAYLCVKKLCKDLNKPCILLRNSGLGSLRKALMELAESRDAKEKGSAAIAPE
jgi:hypothetical protein